MIVGNKILYNNSMLINKVEKLIDSLNRSEEQSITLKHLTKKRILLALAFQYLIEKQEILIGSNSITHILDKYKFSLNNSQLRDFIETYLYNNRIEYGHVYSILAGVLCQEVCKIITKSEEAYSQIYSIDSITTEGNFIKDLSFDSKN